MSVGLLCAALWTVAAAQQPTSKVTLDSSETVFSVLAGISHCGYGGAGGDEIRRQVLSDMASAVAASAEAKADSRELCQFYIDHRQPDGSRELAQYVSLALSMGEQPKFELKGKEADLPPDAAYVLGFRPLLAKFAQSVNLHKIWTDHSYQYSTLLERLHNPISNTLLATDVYLRLPMSGYMGRSFTVFVSPMAGPGPVNARNYGADFWMVIPPSADKTVLDAIRHTYLHFTIDPLVGKRASTMKKLQPLLTTVATAPLDNSYKQDVSLLVEESLIRAIEARMAGRGRDAEPMRVNMVEEDMAEGFVLSRYFFDQLAQFEKEQTGFQDALSDFFYNMDPGKLKKAAEEQVFTAKAAPEVLAKAPPGPLEMAEQRFAGGDYEGARELATQALHENSGDQGQALFLLGQTASMSGDMEGAETYFGRATSASKDPHVVAWSHIYLGRIADIKQERQAALAHYKAALGAGDPDPQTKSAAERGLQKPYELPRQARKKASE